MEGVRRPVGDLPPEVYWRRRIVVLGVLVLVIVVLYFLITAPRGGDNPGGGQSTASATVSPSASPTLGVLGAADPNRPCEEGDVAITATPNPFSVAPGSLPVFDVTISMTGASPCKLTVSNENSELYIRSGGARIFSSTDCPNDATINSREFILQPDAPNEMFQVTWNRQRTAPECATVTTAPDPGYYMATVTLQGIAAPEVQFHLQ